MEEMNLYFMEVFVVFLTSLVKYLYVLFIYFSI
jgi:hypothetical protein